LFQKTAHHGFVVCSRGRELYGVVTITDLEKAFTSGKSKLKVSDICTKDVIIAFSDDTLDDALRHFGALDVGRIPVVDRHRQGRVVGVLSRPDIVRAYSHALVEKDKRSDYIERLRLESASGVKLHEVIIRKVDSAFGKRLKELSLPSDCVIGSIWRGGRAVIPRGNTQLYAGDRLIVFSRESNLETLQTLIRCCQDVAEAN
jgi:CBS domain-containing protein